MKHATKLPNGFGFVETNMSTSPWKSLACGIVKQAWLDYRTLRRSYQKGRVTSLAKMIIYADDMERLRETIIKYEEDFRGEWIAFLLDKEPEYVNGLIRREFGYCLTDVYRRPKSADENERMLDEMLGELDDSITPEAKDKIKLVLMKRLKK